MSDIGTRRLRVTVLFLFVLLIVMLSVPVWASGDDIEVETIVGDNTASVAGSRAYGFGGSDVDINDGYRSYSYLFGLIQETKSNPLEVARQLMAEGNYEGAAVLRCDPWGIHKPFGSKEKCIAVLSKPPTAVAPVIVKEPDKDEDDRLEAVYARISEIEAKSVQDQANTEKATQRAEAQAQAANTRLNQAEEDRKAYAQRMLEQLPEYNDGE